VMRTKLRPQCCCSITFPLFPTAMWALERNSAASAAPSMRELILEFKQAALKMARRLRLNARGRKISRPYEALFSNRFANMRKCGQTYETRQHDKLAILPSFQRKRRMELPAHRPVSRPSAEFPHRVHSIRSAPPNFPHFF